jgi:ABC-type methionine transport system ATPase subunit
MPVRRVYLTYNDKNIQDPLIYEMGHKFRVVTNIRIANIQKGVGLVALAVEGDEDEIERALDWIASKGVKVEPIEKSDAV